MGTAWTRPWVNVFRVQGVVRSWQCLFRSEKLVSIPCLMASRKTGAATLFMAIPTTIHLFSSSETIIFDNNISWRKKRQFKIIQKSFKALKYQHAVLHTFVQLGNQLKWLIFDNHCLLKFPWTSLLKRKQILPGEMSCWSLLTYSSLNHPSLALSDIFYYKRMRTNTMILLTTSISK